MRPSTNWEPARSGGMNNELTLKTIPENVRGGICTIRDAERTRAKMVDPAHAVVRDGVRYWLISDGTERVIPPFVYADAFVECPAEQQAAYDVESSRSIASYKAARAKHGYSDEERFEMRAAFGPGAEVVDCLTGQKVRL